jgi:hypothetical protein
MSESGPRYAAVGCGTRSAISDGNEKSRMYPDKCKKQADEDGESLYVQRQIRVVDRTLVFALPKAGKKRRVPLSSGVLAAART